jgi:dsRNA-specific ribonuclease
VARHSALERRIGHRFKDPSLLAQALTHRSFGSPHYERLEFLGDSVLGCVVTELLFQRHPDLTEGKLSRIRAGLIREESLARIGRELGIAKTRLQEYLQAKRRAKPQYRVLSTSGAKQSLIFEVECAVDELELKATGHGSSRQRAEQQAAGNILSLLGS